MRTGFPVSPVSKSWKELYRAALFETDKSKVSERIAQAEWRSACVRENCFIQTRNSSRSVKPWTRPRTIYRRSAAR